MVLLLLARRCYEAKICAMHANMECTIHCILQFCLSMIVCTYLPPVLNASVVVVEVAQSGPHCRGLGQQGAVGAAATHAAAHCHGNRQLE